MKHFSMVGHKWLMVGQMPTQAHPWLRHWWDALNWSIWTAVLVRHVCIHACTVYVHMYVCRILRWFDFCISLNHIIYPMALFMERLFNAVVISSHYFCGRLHYVLYWVYHNFQYIAMLPCNRTLPFGQLGCVHYCTWVPQYLRKLWCTKSSNLII